MIRACILVIAGGYAAQLSRLPISSDLCKLLIVASVGLFACRRFCYPGCVMLGFACFMLAGQGILAERIDPRFAGDSLLAQVRIIDFPKWTGDSVVMLVEPLNDPRLPRRSRVSWFGPKLTPSIGDVWQFELRLRRPRGQSNPGVFDVEGWLFRQEIHATGYVVGGKRNRRLLTGTESRIDGFRRRFVARSSAAAESRRAAAALAAIGVGARHLISREQWHGYAVSGTSHLMAISGLHVGLAATVAFLAAMACLAPLRTRRNSYVLAILAGVVVAAAYALLSGLGVPALRAVLMMSFAAIALVRRRRVDPFAAVAFAGLSVFLANPIATMTPGFHLSFAAVVVLLWFSRRRETGIGSAGAMRRTVQRLKQLAAMQVFLFFGLAPITVVVFRRIAILAAPVNLLAVPLFSILTVPCTLTGLMLGEVFGPGSALALRVAAVSVEWLGVVTDHVGRLPFADVTTTAPAGLGWLVVFLPALWVLLPAGWPGRRLALLAIPVLLLQIPERPDDGCADAHVLDVGQGLATVIQTRHTTLLFDTGASFRAGGSAAQQIVIPFLESKGVRRLDWLVVSHADDDHSGGVGAIHRYAEVGIMLLGEPLPDSELAAFDCRRGQQWTADGVSFRILHPGPSSSRKGNDSSCVLLIRVGQHSLLLTGDIEIAAERDLLEGSGLSAMDAVVVPHHGSLTSSSMPFVDAVSPMLAIVSAGFANRWGFPKEQVVARWESVGASVLDTATAGAVSVRICAADGIITERTDRHQRRRFWRDSPG